MQYFEPSLRLVGEWSGQDTEMDNFYYDLTSRNRNELGHLVSALVGCSVSQALEFMDELDTDNALRSHIERYRDEGSFGRDSRVAYGRRIGWYAFVRATKPKLVVETGVHHGVGSLVLTSALMRNASEGFLGRYIGTDIDPGAGVLFTEPYSNFGEILVGDSIKSLARLDGPIDIFINDSDHSAEYEGREYEEIMGKLSEASIILGDNSHVTDQLQEFSFQQGRPYFFFAEKPKDHWYPGAGIGISPSKIPSGTFSR